MKVSSDFISIAPYLDAIKSRHQAVKNLHGRDSSKYQVENLWRLFGVTKQAYYKHDENRLLQRVARRVLPILSLSGDPQGSIFGGRSSFKVVGNHCPLPPFLWSFRVLGHRHYSKKTPTIPWYCRSCTFTVHFCPAILWFAWGSNPRPQH